METTLRLTAVLMTLAAVALAGCAPATTPVATNSPAPVSTAAPTAVSAPLSTPTPAGALPPATLPGTDPGTLIATKAFEVVASGGAFVAPEGARPLMVALRPGSPVPALLPDEARAALTTAVAVQDDSLYLVVYAGQQPSSGYGVRIVTVAPSVVGGVARLTVMYLIDRPDPSKGAASVITHPYVIARVRGVNVDPANVTFVPQ